jgi:hypothetical protein
MIGVLHTSEFVLGRQTASIFDATMHLIVDMYQTYLTFLEKNRDECQRSSVVESMERWWKVVCVVGRHSPSNAGY